MNLDSREQIPKACRIGIQLIWHVSSSSNASAIRVTFHTVLKPKNAEWEMVGTTNQMDNAHELVPCVTKPKPCRSRTALTSQAGQKEMHLSSTATTPRLDDHQINVLGKVGELENGNGNGKDSSLEKGGHCGRWERTAKIWGQFMASCYASTTNPKGGD